MSFTKVGYVAALLGCNSLHICVIYQDSYMQNELTEAITDFAAGIYPTCMDRNEHTGALGFSLRKCSYNGDMINAPHRIRLVIFSLNEFPV